MNPLVRLPVALLAAAAASLHAQAQEPPRTIVIALEGCGFELAGALMEAGRLPHLARLAEQGTFVPLQPSVPLDGPVLWAALNSGCNPAETGVVGLVRRKLVGPLGPIPFKGASEVVSVPLGELRDAPEEAQGLARAYPVVRNTNVAEPYWEAAARQGVASVVLGASQAWGRAPVENARVLHRGGIPDARGEAGGYAVYSSDPLCEGRDPLDPAAQASPDGRRLRVDLRDGWVETRLYGPLDFHGRELLEREHRRLERQLDRSFGAGAPQRERIAQIQRDLRALEVPTSLPLTVQVLGPGHAALTLGDETQELFEGQWSDWYHPTFALSGGVRVPALTRAKLASLEHPCFALFVDALEIDPAASLFWQPVSQPSDFARALAAEFGPFSTLGWSALTHPLRDGLIDVDTFLEDAEATLRQRQAMALALMARDDWRLFVTQLSTASRVQHVLAAFSDPAHPLHDPAQAAREVHFLGAPVALGEAVPAVLAELDRFVGRVQEEIARPGDTLLVIGDCAQPSFRRQVHVNNWLAAQGYLVLREGVSPQAARMVHQYVDWPRTRAYSLGLGAVHLNLAGREPQGSVPPAEADALLRELGAAFLELRDPEHPQARVGLEFVLPRDVHAGPYLALEPDLLLGFAPGYRVSWNTASGGIALAPELAPGQTTPSLAPTFEDSDRLWSADQVSLAASAVRGALFCNRPLTLEGRPVRAAHHLNVAPTVLSALGLAIPAAMDLPPLVCAD